MLPSYVQECPKLDRFYLRCDEVVNHVDREDEYFKIRSVSSELLSLNPQYFAVNVSWDYPDAVKAFTLPPPSKRLRGYEVRIRRNNVVVGCWCVSGHNVSSIAIGAGRTPRFQYTASTTMKLEVLTLPFDPKYGEAHYLTSQSRDWPPECNGYSVARAPGSCTPPLVPTPWNVRVNSTPTDDSSKKLAVSWSHSSPTPPPHVYYVYGASDHGNFSVVVNGTKQVAITGLNSSGTYTVWVQGYFHCSGTSAFISGGFTRSAAIGCGGLSDWVAESTSLPLGSPPVPTTPLVFTTTTTTTTQLPHQHIPLLLPLILSGLAVVLGSLTAVSVLLGVLIYRCYRKSPSPIIVDEHDLGYEYQVIVPQIKPKPKVKPDVLVLYSLKTPSSEQELIECYVVARLKQKYRVNSCNDHTEKTVVQWVEEQARHAHSVLIVCNESFHSDWNSRDRSPLLNSLNAIINSAVSHDNLSKFATVLLRSDSDRYIPDNLYIEGMTSFDVDVDGVYADMEDVFNFLKQNKDN